MAVVAITGVMGAGKTYLAVRDKLIPFLKEGRTIVTSIAIADSCFPVIANYLGINLAELRERLIVLDNAQLVEMIQKKTLFSHPVKCPTGLIKPGYVFIPDEAWALAKKGRNTYDERFEEFVKMHRHYKDEKGRTVEIVLITQSLRQLNSDLTDVVELELKCKKQKALGKPNSFTVAYHEGGSRSASHY
jgi:zona occludens toxin